MANAQQRDYQQSGAGVRAGVCAAVVAALALTGLGDADAAERPTEPAECHLLGPDEEDPVRTGACPGVRPGAAVRTDLGGCTFNYVFVGHDPDEEQPPRLLIGTAGHCILDSSGQERVWAPGQGPVARDGSNRQIGRFVYARWTSVRDFALIEVFDGISVNPQMCHYGGPTGYASLAAGPLTLHHSGQGILLGSTVPGRTHVARRFDNPDSIRFDGAVIFGDSGSPVNTATGRAGGVVVSIGANADGPMRATRLRPQVVRAEDVLDLDLQLQTAPRL